MILTKFAHFCKFTMAIFHYKTVNNFIKCLIILIISDSFIVQIYGEMMYLLLMKHLAPIYIKKLMSMRKLLAWPTSLHFHIHPRSSSSCYWVPSLTITGTTCHHWSHHHHQNLHDAKYTYRYTVLSTYTPWSYLWDEWRRFLYSPVYPSVSTKLINVSHI